VKIFSKKGLTKPLFPAIIKVPKGKGSKTMKIKIGQVWKHPYGYILKVANYDDTSGKYLMKVCGQNYYFYAKPQTILTWQLQKKA